VPNYNNAGWLPRALGAMLRQELPPDEIIVVDDGSTDNSIEVIEAFQRRHGSIRLIRHPQNRGAAAALNTGLAAACGEFVYFGAADDFIFSHFLATAIAALKAHPQAAYFAARTVLVENDRILGIRPFLRPHPVNAFIPPAQVCRLLERIDNWAVGQSVVLRRKALQEIGGFDEGLGSLCDGVVYRLLGCRDGFYFSDSLVGAWEIRADSISARAATSQTQTRLIEKVHERFEHALPPALAHSYPELFERRLRFSMARILMMSRDGTPEALADLVQSPPFERRFITMMGIGSRLARTAILAWLTCRLRPFGFAALAQAWLDTVRHGRAQREVAMRAIRDTIGTGAAMQSEADSAAAQGPRGMKRLSS
jgi:glycosyltransferase involved in cell wall biosynthesis